MTITETQRGFEITFPFDLRLKNAIKAINGSFFRGADKTWVVPKHRSRDVEQLKKRFGYSNNNDAAIDMPEQTGNATEMPALDVELNIPRKLFPFQKTGVAYCRLHKRVIIGDQPGLGKAQPLTAKIATPNGWITMGDAKVGQPVIGKDGNTYFITGVYPQGLKPCYSITFNDGSKTECCEEHLWSVSDVMRRRRGTGWVVKSVKQLLAAGIHHKTNQKRSDSGRKPVLKFEIPLIQPFTGVENDFLIHPYVLGVLIGDGAMSGKKI